MRHDAAMAQHQQLGVACCRMLIGAFASGPSDWWGSLRPRIPFYDVLSVSSGARMIQALERVGFSGCWPFVPEGSAEGIPSSGNQMCIESDLQLVLGSW